eukprot:jgi/Mesvir1/26640/Mv24037-RA.1
MGDANGDPETIVEEPAKEGSHIGYHGRPNAQENGSTQQESPFLGPSPARPGADVSVSRYINSSKPGSADGWTTPSARVPASMGVTQDEPSHEGGVASEPAGVRDGDRKSRGGAAKPHRRAAAGSAANATPAVRASPPDVKAAAAGGSCVASPVEGQAPGHIHVDGSGAGLTVTPRVTRLRAQGGAAAGVQATSAGAQVATPPRKPSGSASSGPPPAMAGASVTAVPAEVAAKKASTPTLRAKRPASPPQAAAPGTTNGVDVDRASKQVGAPGRRSKASMSAMVAGGDAKKEDGQGELLHLLPDPPTQPKYIANKRASPRGQAPPQPSAPNPPATVPAPTPPQGAQTGESRSLRARPAPKVASVGPETRKLGVAGMGPAREPAVVRPLVRSASDEVGAMEGAGSDDDSDGDAGMAGVEVSEETLAEEDAILEQAAEIQRHGAVVMAASRLPRFPEPARPKVHWDYLLEEMEWLAKDFQRERKWKSAQAKKLATKVSKSDLHIESRQLRRAKEEKQHMRRTAQHICRQVMSFWGKIDCLVRYKHQAILASKKKRAMDKHLDFLVGQTERYSTLLAENLLLPRLTDGAAGSPASAATSSKGTHVVEGAETGKAGGSAATAGAGSAAATSGAGTTDESNVDAGASKAVLMNASGGSAEQAAVLTQATGGPGTSGPDGSRAVGRASTSSGVLLARAADDAAGPQGVPTTADKAATPLTAGVKGDASKGTVGDAAPLRAAAVRGDKQVVPHAVEAAALLDEPARRAGSEGRDRLVEKGSTLPAARPSGAVPSGTTGKGLVDSDRPVKAKLHWSQALYQGGEEGDNDEASMQEWVAGEWQEEEDDERTLEEDERALEAEGGVGRWRDELAALRKEGEMPIEELLAMYRRERGGMSDSEDDGDGEGDGGTASDHGGDGDGGGVSVGDDDHGVKGGDAGGWSEGRGVGPAQAEVPRDGEAGPQPASGEWASVALAPVPLIGNCDVKMEDAEMTDKKSVVAEGAALVTGPSRAAPAGSAGQGLVDGGFVTKAKLHWSQALYQGGEEGDNDEASMQEWVAGDGQEEEDDERTLEEDELALEAEGGAGRWHDELAALRKEGEMPIEELLAMYRRQHGEETDRESEDGGGSDGGGDDVGMDDGGGGDGGCRDERGVEPAQVDVPLDVKHGEAHPAVSDLALSAPVHVPASDVDHAKVEETETWDGRAVASSGVASGGAQSAHTHVQDLRMIIGHGSSVEGLLSPKREDALLSPPRHAQGVVQSSLPAEQAPPTPVVDKGKGVPVDDAHVGASAPIMSRQPRLAARAGGTSAGSSSRAVDASSSSGGGAMFVQFYANRAAQEGPDEDDSDDGGSEFDGGEEEDDERTMAEEEALAAGEDHAAELDRLREEQNMSLEDILARYRAMAAHSDEDSGEGSSQSGEDEGDADADDHPADAMDVDEAGDREGAAVMSAELTVGTAKDGPSAEAVGADTRAAVTEGPAEGHEQEPRRTASGMDAEVGSLTGSLGASSMGAAHVADGGDGALISHCGAVGGLVTATEVAPTVEGEGGISMVGGDGDASQEPRPSSAADGEGEEVADGRTNKERLEDAAAAASAAQPTGYTLLTTQVKTKVPFLLKHGLREYQHIGLDWLVTMYERRLNGILADEMGLGKTIMTISLLAHLACDKGVWGPHLIVVPTSVMVNWETEFKKWCPAFKIITYFGSVKERKLKRQGWCKPNNFHVCITTYRLVIQDFKIFRRRKWKYLILDEAHMIKNWRSQRWQLLLNFNSKRRLLLTGTPLQNDLMELWSLMHFLMPHVFQSHAEFRDWFCNPLTGMVEGQEAVNKELVERLHGVLRPFILRRLKCDVEKQLPQKHEHVLVCRLSRRQRQLYEEFMDKSETRATLASGNFLGVINCLMQLRKVCNHPDLFEGRAIESPFDMEPLVMHVGTLAIPLLSPTTDRRHRTSQDGGVGNGWLLDASSYSEAGSLVGATAAGTAGLPGSAPSSDRFPCHLQLVARARDAWRAARWQHLGHTSTLRCAGARPLYGRDLRQCLTVEMPVAYAKRLAEQPRRYWDVSHALASLLRSPLERCLEAQEMLETFGFATMRARVPPPEAWCSHPPPYRVTAAQRHAGVLAAVASPLLTPLRTAHIRRHIFFPDRRLIQFDCGKLQELAVLLRRLRAGGHRCLIFTQMAKMLDVLESFINLYKYPYLRLDGSTKPEQRQILMQRFNSDPKLFLFILSTRSGGVGVNLVGADTVIFYDSDWNPAMDQQAQDRCHRIGQTREVHIYRLVSEGTIEENILKKATQKRALDDLVIQKGGYNMEFFSRLDPRELFGGKMAAQRLVEARPGAAATGPNAPSSSSNADVRAVTDAASAMDGADVAEGGSARAEGPGGMGAREGGQIAGRGTGVPGGSSGPLGGGWSALEVEAALAVVEDESDAAAARQLERETADELREFTEDPGPGVDEAALDDEELGGGGGGEGGADTGVGGKGDGVVEGGEAGAADGWLARPGSADGGWASGAFGGGGDVMAAAGMEGDEMLEDVRVMLASGERAGRDAEDSIASWERQLRPVERYAMRFLEEVVGVVDTRARQADVTIEEKEWELERLEKLKVEQEAEADEEEAEVVIDDDWDAEGADEAYRRQLAESARMAEERAAAEEGALAAELEAQERRAVLRAKKLLRKQKKKLAAAAEAARGAWIEASGESCEDEDREEGEAGEGGEGGQEGTTRPAKKSKREQEWEAFVRSGFGGARPAGFPPASLQQQQQLARKFKRKKSLDTLEGGEGGAVGSGGWVVEDMEGGDSARGGDAGGVRKKRKSLVFYHVEGSEYEYYDFVPKKVKDRMGAGGGGAPRFLGPFSSGGGTADGDGADERRKKRRSAKPATQRRTGLVSVRDAPSWLSAPPVPPEAWPHLLGGTDVAEQLAWLVTYARVADAQADAALQEQADREVVAYVAACIRDHARVAGATSAEPWPHFLAALPLSTATSGATLSSTAYPAGAAAVTSLAADGAAPGARWTPAFRSMVRLAVELGLAQGDDVFRDTVKTLPKPRVWDAEEDVLMADMVNMFGPNWRLVSDALQWCEPSLGALRDLPRHPVHCIHHYKVLLANAAAYQANAAQQPAKATAPSANTSHLQATFPKAAATPALEAGAGADVGLGAPRAAGLVSMSTEPGGAMGAPHFGTSGPSLGAGAAAAAVSTHADMPMADAEDDGVAAAGKGSGGGKQAGLPSQQRITVESSRRLVATLQVMHARERLSVRDGGPLPGGVVAATPGTGTPEAAKAEPGDAVVGVAAVVANSSGVGAGVAGGNVAGGNVAGRGVGVGGGEEGVDDSISHRATALLHALLPLAARVASGRLAQADLVGAIATSDKPKPRPRGRPPSHANQTAPVARTAPSVPVPMPAGPVPGDASTSASISARAGDGGICAGIPAVGTAAGIGASSACMLDTDASSEDAAVLELRRRLGVASQGAQLMGGPLAGGDVGPGGGEAAASMTATALTVATMAAAAPLTTAPGGMAGTREEEPRHTEAYLSQGTSQMAVLLATAAAATGPHGAAGAAAGTTGAATAGAAGAAGAMAAAAGTGSVPKPVAAPLSVSYVVKPPHPSQTAIVNSVLQSAGVAHGKGHPGGTLAGGGASTPAPLRHSAELRSPRHASAGGGPPIPPDAPCSPAVVNLVLSAPDTAVMGKLWRYLDPTAPVIPAVQRGGTPAGDSDSSSGLPVRARPSLTPFAAAAEAASHVPASAAAEGESLVREVLAADGVEEQGMAGGGGDGQGCVAGGSHGDKSTDDRIGATGGERAEPTPSPPHGMEIDGEPGPASPATLAGAQWGVPGDSLAAADAILRDSSHLSSCEGAGGALLRRTPADAMDESAPGGPSCCEGGGVADSDGLAPLECMVSYWVGDEDSADVAAAAMSQQAPPLPPPGEESMQAEWQAWPLSLLAVGSAQPSGASRHPHPLDVLLSATEALPRGSSARAQASASTAPAGLKSEALPWDPALREVGYRLARQRLLTSITTLQHRSPQDWAVSELEAMMASYAQPHPTASSGAGPGRPPGSTNQAGARGGKTAGAARQHHRNDGVARPAMPSTAAREAVHGAIGVGSRDGEAGAATVASTMEGGAPPRGRGGRGRGRPPGEHGRGRGRGRGRPPNVAPTPAAVLSL